MANRAHLEVEALERYAFIESLVRADFPPPARIVELGAAPGDQIARFAQLGYDATAVDIGDSSDEWADGEAGRMTRLLRDSGVVDVRWNLEETPYPLADESFDVVIMTEVYEHLWSYPARSLLEVRRILRPGGRLYFTTPNQTYVVNRLRFLAGHSVSTPLPDWIGGVPHARHFREYTVGEVRQLMDYAGLTIRLLTGRHFHRTSGRTAATIKLTKRALNLLAQLRPSLGPQIIVVAEHPG